MAKKILYITARADISGGPSHLNTLLQGISKLDKNLDIFIAAPSNQYFTQSFIDNAIKFIPIPFRKFSIVHLISLITLVKNEGIQVIHAHGRGAGIYAKLIKLFCSTHYIHTFHGIHVEQSLTDKIKGSFDRFFKFNIDTNVFLTSKEKLIARTLRYNFGESIIVENGVNQSEIIEKVSKLDKTKILAQYNLPHDKKYVCTLLRNDPVKGLDLLLSKIKKIKDENVFFVIAGVDPIEAPSHGNNVKFIGKTDGPYNVLKIADLIVSHSRSEGMPLTMLEASSLYIPMLLSNIDGHNIFFKRNVALPFDDLESFNEGISTLLSSSSVLSRNNSFCHYEMTRKLLLSYSKKFS